MNRRPGGYVPRDGDLPVYELHTEVWDEELAALPQPSQAERAVAAARASAGPQLRHAADLALFALAVIGAIAGAIVGFQHLTGDPLADTVAYFEASNRLNHGQPLYPSGVDPSTNEIYLYPPLLAVVMRPVALLGYEFYALVWEAIVIVSFVALLRYLGVRRRAVWLAIGILGVPIAWALTVAQAHVPMTYLIALGQPWSVALAANLKLFPALLALWWLGRRDYESLLAFLAWAALLGLGQLLLERQGTLAFFGSVGLDQLGEVRNFSPFVLHPALWVGLLAAGALAVLALARTRWGWPAAVALATLAPPRLLVYMLTSLLAALRQPKVAGVADPDADWDVASVFSRSVR
ncbi:MAG: DUF2029 domain-containing protein [Chloroflexi bacterium]|nr:DUF2029 domain-containing protein [Chloroflexota bacterium]